eukprot:Tamp_02371.p1 GENE.Tamp_02371~~Tamp_02371.p1  ORF type:complete len:1122 (+),score=154.63 Tamp_02371:551-3916(+)
MVCVRFQPRAPVHAWRRKVLVCAREQNVEDAHLRASNAHTGGQNALRSSEEGGAMAMGGGGRPRDSQRKGSSPPNSPALQGKTAGEKVINSMATAAQTKRGKYSILGTVEEANALFIDGRRLVRTGQQRTVMVSRLVQSGGPVSDVVGIGISFRPASDGSFVVADLVKNGGAQLSGVLIGDVIVAVEGHMVSTLTTSQLVKYIKGPPGTSVQLSLEATTDSGDTGRSAVEDPCRVVPNSPPRATEAPRATDAPSTPGAHVCSPASGTRDSLSNIDEPVVSMLPVRGEGEGDRSDVSLPVETNVLRPDESPPTAAASKHVIATNMPASTGSTSPEQDRPFARPPLPANHPSVQDLHSLHLVSHATSPASPVIPDAVTEGGEPVQEAKGSRESGSSNAVKRDIFGAQATCQEHKGAGDDVVMRVQQPRTGVTPVATEQTGAISNAEADDAFPQQTMSVTTKAHVTRAAPPPPAPSEGSNAVEEGSAAAEGGSNSAPGPSAALDALTGAEGDGASEIEQQDEPWNSSPQAVTLSAKPPLPLQRKELPQHMVQADVVLENQLFLDPNLENRILRSPSHASSTAASNKPEAVEWVRSPSVYSDVSVLTIWEVQGLLQIAERDVGTLVADLDALLAAVSQLHDYKKTSITLRRLAQELQADNSALSARNEHLQQDLASARERVQELQCLLQTQNETKGSLEQRVGDVRETQDTEGRLTVAEHALEESRESTTRALPDSAALAPGAAPEVSRSVSDKCANALPQSPAAVDESTLQLMHQQFSSLREELTKQLQQNQSLKKRVDSLEYQLKEAEAQQGNDATHAQVVDLIKGLQAERDNNRFLRQSLQELSEGQAEEKQQLLCAAADWQRQLVEMRHVLMRREEQIRHLKQQQQEQVQVVENKHALQISQSLLEKTLSEEQEARARDVDRLKRTVATLLDALDARGLGDIADAQLDLLRAEFCPARARSSDDTGAGEIAGRASDRERDTHLRENERAIVSPPTQLNVNIARSPPSVNGEAGEGVGGQMGGRTEMVRLLSAGSSGSLPQGGRSRKGLEQQGRGGSSEHPGWNVAGGGHDDEGFEQVTVAHEVARASSPVEWPVNAPNGSINPAVTTVSFFIIARTMFLSR